MTDKPNGWTYLPPPLQREAWEEIWSEDTSGPGGEKLADAWPRYFAEPLPETSTALAWFGYLDGSYYLFKGERVVLRSMEGAAIFVPSAIRRYLTPADMDKRSDASKTALAAQMTLPLPDTLPRMRMLGPDTYAMDEEGEG